MSLELLLEVGKVSRTTFQGQGKREGASDHLGPDHGSTGGHIFLMTFANMLIIVSLETNIFKKKKKHFLRSHLDGVTGQGTHQQRRQEKMR